MMGSFKADSYLLTRHRHGIVLVQAEESAEVLRRLHEGPSPALNATLLTVSVSISTSVVASAPSPPPLLPQDVWPKLSFAISPAASSLGDNSREYMQQLYWSWEWPGTLVIFPQARSGCEVWDKN